METVVSEDKELATTLKEPVPGPVPSGWAEATLTRARELEALARWVLSSDDHAVNCSALSASVAQHITAARQARKCPVRNAGASSVCSVCATAHC